MTKQTMTAAIIENPSIGKDDKVAIAGKEVRRYDVCIIGAGPAGLASLSAIMEPYSLDGMTNTQVNNANRGLGRGGGGVGGTGGGGGGGGDHHYAGRGMGPTRGRKVCVIDPNENWLGSWNDNFARLGIEYLRSPAMAHPDHFDVNSLLAYAVSNHREHELYDSGCSSLRQLNGLGHQTHVGLWKLPSTDLFRDFCQTDVVGRLNHDYVRGTAIDLARIGGRRVGVVGGDEDDGTRDDGGYYAVKLSDGTYVESTSVILALGPTGVPVIPPGVRDVPADRLISWRHMDEKLRDGNSMVLVVGGGLTAVQAAQYCLRKGKSVILSSRRTLVERHFDIRECWFDKRRANRHVSDFYHQNVEERLVALREARGGGSVPPLYMDDLRVWDRRGKLTIVDDADPVFVRTDGDGGDGGRLWISMRAGKERGEDGGCRSNSSLVGVDCVVLACGIRPDCTTNPLVKNILDRFPIDIVGGLPDVSVDLEWTRNLFVVGALASLNVGPDGGNIMGARRAATIVSNALECKSWLRREGVGALSNPFQMLSDDGDSSSDDDSDSD